MPTSNDNEFNNRNIFIELNKNSLTFPSSCPNIFHSKLDKIINKLKFNTKSFNHYLCLLKDYFNKTNSELAKKSNFKETYIKDLYTWKRKPSRDAVIALSVAFELNNLETNLLLKSAGYNELYQGNRRDFIISKHIFDKYTILAINKSLLSYKEKPIGNLDQNESYL